MFARAAQELSTVRDILRFAVSRFNDAALFFGHGSDNAHDEAAYLILHTLNLSRTLEDAGTVINPLVPWSVCGVFISHALNVPVWEYLPYAFFCYLCLVLTLLFGWTGFTLTKK